MMKAKIWNLTCLLSLLVALILTDAGLHDPGLLHEIHILLGGCR